MILYIDNSKDSTKKLLDLINKYSKVAGYKVNIQSGSEWLTQNGSLLSTNNELSEREIKKIVPLAIARTTKSN